MNKFKPLLSCPFCETQAKIVENDVGLFKAECANELCGVRPSTEYKNTRHEAFKDWDTRPSYSSFEELKTVLTINEQFLSATRHLIADGTSSFNLEDELVIRKDVEKIIAEQNRRIQELELEKADALQGNRYAQLERMAINRAKKAEEEIERLKSVSTGKIPELSGVITREMVRQAMFDEWYEICMDTGHHPDDIIQLPRRGLDFSPLHWCDAVYRNISDKLGKTFQNRVQPWMTSCFGKAVANDKMERCDRFLEEALELVQAIGYSPERGHALVDYVFNRDTGQPHQEVGGVMVTLAALCLATNLTCMTLEKTNSLVCGRRLTKFVQNKPQSPRVPHCQLQ